jgi:hypothetical protein
MKHPRHPWFAAVVIGAAGGLALMLGVMATFAVARPLYLLFVQANPLGAMIVLGLPAVFAASRSFLERRRETDASAALVGYVSGVTGGLLTRVAAGMLFGPAVFPEGPDERVVLTAGLLTIVGSVAAPTYLAKDAYRRLLKRRRRTPPVKPKDRRIR